MAKDYFQDVIPPDEGHDLPRQVPASSPSVPGDRSIRNVSIPQRPNSMSDTRMSERNASYPPVRRSSGSKMWLWVIAFIALLVIGLVLVLFIFRNTTVTVTPQSQPVVFDQGSQFTAFPADSAATGTLTYTVASTDLTASSVVQASGTQHAEVKAVGTLTVVNDYSDKPVTLIKNTRFETPDGLIFRTPTAVVVPGKSGTTPGKASVGVVADQAGAQYNIGPTNHFTVPGLQSTPSMYANIYGYSTASTTGGFSGDRPSVDPATASTTIASLRTQLAEQVQSYAQSQNATGTLAFAGLAQISYQDMPETVDTDGTVHMNESAHVLLPVFPANQFANAVAQTVSADATNASVRIIPGQGFAAAPLSQNLSLGSSSLTFSLAGQAEIVWNIDTNALAQALAGHNQSAFQGITSNFPGIKEAHARIEPFWESTFPSNPASIHISVLSPAVGSTASGNGN